MPLQKQIKDLKIAIFIPSYKRYEYTKMCLDALHNAQTYTQYGLVEFCHTEDDNPNVGLRERTIDFFEYVNKNDFDLIAKVDNDCIVPNNWLDDMVKVFKNSDVDILAPNVMPSNAAFVNGCEDREKKGYRPSDIVGGVWVMKASLIKDIYFERVETLGLSGAITLLRQIITETEAILGWNPEVTFEDVGHWSGKHELHIKSKDHEDYSMEVGRKIAWAS